jgi:ubiquinone/menaquinone biosynthesis C-methylase UbiE
MSSSNIDAAPWGASYRTIAAEKWRRQSARMGSAATEALVRLAAPRPGMRVLDVASGTGEPAISLASASFPDGQVTGVDLNRSLLELASGRARKRGLPGISFAQADAHELPFASDSFDLVTSRLGVMFFSDVGQALREMRRVLKPGGRAALLAWGPIQQPYFESTIAIVHKFGGGTLLPPGSPNMFRFASEGSLSRELEDAGFARVHERLTTVPWPWEGPPEQVWEYFREVTVPFRPIIDRIPSDKAPQIDQEVLSAIGRYYDGRCVNFTATFVLADATR